ncbi:MAG: aminotransferase class III-fold pyridoxal phosphate-dependent enzyme [Anaerolineales bacterium]|nr:aminotransferase class III-fold pyridoxal phosphate-dependent enzyme [Anaerolineales bacterium]
MGPKASEQDLQAGREAMIGGGVGAGTPMVIDHGLGASVWDTTGQEYIDCTSQAWSLNVGYCHPKVVAAVIDQVQRFTHIRTSFDTVPKLLLAKKLSELGPGRLKKVGYSLTGSDANEGAMKLAMRNRPGNVFVTLWDGYHGRTLSTLNLSWPHPNNRFTAWKGEVLRIPQAYCYRCPFDNVYPACGLECARFARQAILKGASEPPAALMMEPVQGNGGMIDFPPDYYPALRALCDDLGMLMVWDEIQTGFGRVGDWFAANVYKTEPDILIFGKGLGGGFPLFGTLSRTDLKPLEPGDHSFTFAHFPVSMVAALATITAIEEENLLERSRLMGGLLRDGLLRLKDKYELIGDVRGPALMIGVELVRNRKTKEPAREEAHRFIAEGLKRGVIFGESKYSGLGNIVKVKPPLVIAESQIERVLQVFEEITQLLSVER